VITDRAAFDAWCEAERWQRLADMTVEESIALGEALLTSELMDLSTFPDDDRPMSLAKALGIEGRRHGERDAPET
jgi:hypothetical protein